MRNILKSMAGAALIAMASTAVAWSHEIKSGDLVISNMWSRATPGGAKVAGGYFTVSNTGTVADRLVSATSPASGKVEVHEMSMANGVMTMRPLDAGLVVEPGKSVTLAPGGFHMMLMDLKEPLKEGGMLPITLAFEKAGKVEVTLHVRSIGAQGPIGEAKKSDDHSGHKM